MLWSSILSRYYVYEEVEHVTLGQRASDVTPLQRPSLVLLSVNPGTHRELSDEHVTSLGKEDWSLSRDHFDLGICLHDLLDASERELVQLVVVVVRLQVCDLVLPVRVEYVTIVARESLRHLCRSVEVTLIIS